MLAVARNPANLKLLAEALEGYGRTVRTASEPEELEGAAGWADELALALVDADGYGDELWALVEVLVEEDVPVIVVAKVRDEELQQKALFHNATLVLEKPLRPGNLKAVIRSLLDRSG